MLSRIVKRIPFVRNLGHQVPPHFTGSVLENRLGLQVARTLAAEVSRRARRAPTSDLAAPYLNVIERDGVLTMPDFLPQAQFQDILREFEGLKGNLTYRPTRGQRVGRLHEAKYPIEPTDPACRAMTAHLAENPLIREIAMGVTKRRVERSPTMSIDIYRVGDPSESDNDIENLLHADTHFPTVKAWYLLNDVDEGNGAFVYAKGSHRFTMARLKHEYGISVNTARLNAGDRGIPPEIVAERGEIRRIITSAAERAAMNIQETAICGKANSLVIANNMGFHRRGHFTSERPREWIIINFRNIESRRFKR